MMTPEEQIILVLARGKLSSRVQEQALALLATPLNWNLILDRAMAEDVYPLFYRNLVGCAGREQGAGNQRSEVSDQKSAVGQQLARSKEQSAGSDEHGADAISDFEFRSANWRSEVGGRSSSVVGRRSEAEEQLHKLSRINAFRNTLLTEELVRLLHLLAEARVSTIPLKGVALAESLYRDTAARVCSDIDILVPRRHVGEAFRVLLAAGFEAHDEKVNPSELQRLLDSNIEYSFVRRSQGMSFLVELHWDIAWRWGKNSIMTDDLWAEAQPKSYWGVEGYALSPEWERLYLAVHAAHHQWQGLKWLVDIDEMCGSSTIDWKRLREKANRLGLHHMLALTLSACHSRFDTKIPDDFYVNPLPSWMKIFPDHPASSDIWKDNFFPARLFRRPTQKLGYLARIAFVPTLNEQRIISLPSFLSFLYYPLRPLRLMCKWSWGWLRGFAAPEVSDQRSDVSFGSKVLHGRSCAPSLPSEAYRSARDMNSTHR